MDKFILDTNLFFNMEAGLNMGERTEEVVVNLSEIIKKLRQNKKAEFYTSPKIIEEFLSFFEDKEQLFIKEFISLINIKSPDVSISKFSAAVFYKLIDEIRTRSYRGLSIAQEEIIRAAKAIMDSGSLNKKDFEIKTGPFIKNLRERYRQATRFGFLDSTADLDLIVLAQEQDGFLVSSDEGVIRWARLFGVKEMPVGVFQKRLALLASG